MHEAKVVAVHLNPIHNLSKKAQEEIFIVEGQGVRGDAHMGATVKHRSRVLKDPTQANLRQVHLMHEELFQELEKDGFKVSAGQMGENITTKGIALLDLPRNTILSIGQTTKILITGLRNPCNQLNGIQNGLMNALVYKDEKGTLIGKAGIMSIVLESGSVKAGDNIHIEYPQEPFVKLDRV